MRLACFYHVWCDGAWQQPLGEHLAALDESGFDGVFAVGLVGASERRREVQAALADRWAPEIVAEARTSFEKPTLDAVLAYAKHYDGAVMYAHTKGAAENTEFRARWRRSMTARVIVKWRQNLALLENADAVGCHWLTDEQFPGMLGAEQTESGFFGGNFWLARCDYLRTLSPCDAEPRWKAESWVGSNNPRVVDLLPGWPHDRRWPELCTSSFPSPACTGKSLTL